MPNQAIIASLESELEYWKKGRDEIALKADNYPAKSRERIALLTTLILVKDYRTALTNLISATIDGSEDLEKRKAIASLTRNSLRNGLDNLIEGRMEVAA